MEERLRLALLTLLLLSPLPFGCVEDWSRWLLVTLLALAFCGVLWYRIPILLSPREKKAAILGCIYAGWLLVQLVPLPPSLLARLSPSAHHLYQIGVPGYGTSDPKGYAYPDPEQISAGRDLRDVTWVVPGLSAWRSLSLYPYGTYRVFWQTAALIGFTIIGLSLFRDREDRRRLAGVLVAVGVFQAAYGAIEALSGHQHIFAYEKRYYTDVATGTLVNRNHFAAMLNMVLPLALALLLVRVRALSAQGVRASRTRLARWSLLAGEPWFLACAVTIGLGVVLSRSRMGVLAMLAGVAGFGVLAARWGAADAAAAARLRQRSHTRWAIVVPLILIAIIAAVALGMDAAPTLDRFVRISEDLKQGATRPALWKEGLGTAVEYLWTGAGAGAYVHALNPHLETLFSSDFWIFNHAHN
ncbi:MAG TPA: O-antigen ligase family protein, partial [Candidatus Polarisedimenticolia bacterium]|nr:O-antigen ligase family protein [Candidatus Polarisedimenticolia bacterium]